MMNHRNGPPVDAGCWKGVIVVFAAYAVSAVVIMLAAHLANLLAAGLSVLGVGR